MQYKNQDSNDFDIFASKQLFANNKIGLNCPVVYGCLDFSLLRAEHRNNCPKEYRDLCLKRASQYVSFKHMQSGIPQKYASARSTDIDKELRAQIQEGFTDEDGHALGSLLFISGPVGVGKTWTAAGIAAHIFEKQPSTNLLWFNGRTMESTFRSLWAERAAYKARDPQSTVNPHTQFIKKFINADIAFIDGFCDTQISKSVMTDVLEMLDKRTERQVPTVITTNITNMDDFVSVLMDADYHNKEAVIDRVLEASHHIEMSGESRRSASLSRTQTLPTKLAKWVSKTYKRPSNSCYVIEMDEDDFKITDMSEEASRIYTPEAPQKEEPDSPEYIAWRKSMAKSRERRNNLRTMARTIVEHKFARPDLTKDITKKVYPPDVYVRRVREHLEDMRLEPGYIDDLALEQQFIIEDDFAKHKIYINLKDSAEFSGEDLLKEFRKQCLKYGKKLHETRAYKLELRNSLIDKQTKRRTKYIQEDDLLKEEEMESLVDDFGLPETKLNKRKTKKKDKTNKKQKP